MSKHIKEDVLQSNASGSLKGKKRAGKKVSASSKLKKSSLSDLQDDCSADQAASSFTQMSDMLKECMLGQRWHEASKLLRVMCLYPTPETDYQWKCGLHLMENHHNGETSLTERLLSVVNKLEYKGQHEKKLEHALYLLSQNRIEDAYKTIGTKIHKVGAVSNHNSQHEDMWKALTTAYTGLIEYFMWCQHKVQDDPHGQENQEDSGQSKSAEILSTRALSNLAAMNDFPGVWDVFITKQIEILESQADFYRGELLLNKYCDTNPDNPNAHVYLYYFLKRHNGNNFPKLKAVLKKLMELLPAENYTLDFIEILEKTDAAVPRRVLPCLFKMADYSSCHGNLAMWKLLAKYTVAASEIKNSSGKKVVRECWDSRKSWWPSYHFHVDQVSFLLKRHQLATEKAILATVLLGSDHAFVQKVYSGLDKKHASSAKRLDKIISQRSKASIKAK